MKKRLMFLLLLIGLLIPIRGSTQTYEDNRVYLSFQPGDTGLGLKVEHNTSYVSFSLGNYWLPNGGYIKDHLKMTIGGIISDTYIVGINYHQYGAIKETIPLEKAALYKITFELGARIIVKEPFCVAIRMDPIQWQGTVDFGWLFH